MDVGPVGGVGAPLDLSGGVLERAPSLLERVRSLPGASGRACL